MLKTPFQEGPKCRSLTTKNWIFNHGAYTDYCIRTSECRMRQLIFRHYDDNTCVFLCRRQGRACDVYRFGKNLKFEEIVALRENLYWSFDFHGRIPKYILEKLKIIIPILTKSMGTEQSYRIEDYSYTYTSNFWSFLEKLLWEHKRNCLLTELRCNFQISHDLKYSVRALNSKGITSVQDLKALIPEKVLRRHLFTHISGEMPTSSKLDLLNKEYEIVYKLKSKKMDINHIVTLLSLKRTYYDYYPFLSKIPEADYLKWYNLLRVYGTYDYLFRDTYNYFYYYQNECKKRNVIPAKIALKAGNLQKAHDELVNLWNKIKFAPEPVTNPVELSNIDSLNDEKYTYMLPQMTTDLKTWGNIMSNCIGGYKPTKITGLVAVKDTTTDKMLYNIELRINSWGVGNTKEVVFYQFMAHANRRVADEESREIKKAITKLIVEFKEKPLELVAS